jgi:hypothetical protein
LAVEGGGLWLAAASLPLPLLPGRILHFRRLAGDGGVRTGLWETGLWKHEMPATRVYRSVAGNGWPRAITFSVLFSALLFAGFIKYGNTKTIVLTRCIFFCEKSINNHRSTMKPKSNKNYKKVTGPPSDDYKH